MIDYGLLIAIEGLDKSGKETQAELLAQKFLEIGEEVVTVDFPAYDNKTGQFLEDMLNGYHFIAPDSHPYEFQAIQTLNRYEEQSRIENAYMKGKVVICDRYIHSGLAYGMASGVDRDWLEEIQHSLVKPDIVIFLDISIEEYQKRCENYDNLDLNESNLEYIKTVKDVYHLLKEENPDWIVVNGEQPKEVIAHEIFTRVIDRIQEMEVQF